MIRVTTSRYSFELVNDGETAYPVLSEVTCPRDVVRIAQHVIGSEITECLIAVFLTARQRVSGYTEIARGRVNAARLQPRDLLVPALHAGCCSVVIAHKHPGDSGEPTSPRPPSRDDRGRNPSHDGNGEGALPVHWTDDE